jgi:Ser/Thr protein kinase RdoA (MazF antagonist)
MKSTKKTNKGLAVLLAVAVMLSGTMLSGMGFAAEGPEGDACDHGHGEECAYIEGADCDPEFDIEAIGALVGRLHYEMKDYPGEFIKRDKHFYIGRYIDILRNRKYPRAEEFSQYGERIWEKIKLLPRGYCHGDMYDGNIRKTPNGKLYIHDFDTSCEGFPMYDVTLICDMTEYFNYDERNLSRSNKMLSRFLPEYKKFSPISQAEIDAFHALIALQHFSTQATVMEIFGHYCLNDQELDQQLEWLYRWREQCESECCNCYGRPVEQCLGGVE